MNNQQSIKMFDPTRHYLKHKEEYDNAVMDVMASGRFINGPAIKQLENQLSEYVKVNHSVAVSNGTDALMIALMALGVGVNDEVITVPFTWISTAEVISIIGAKPVFVDVDRETFNMDVNKLEAAITTNTRAIIVVSLYGQIADMEKIGEIASKYCIPVIEDGAQSFGSERNGYKSCSCSWEMNLISTTSFFPTKPLGGYGDGGACFTNDDNLADKLRMVRNHGGLVRFKHEMVGTNGRYNTLQAAILLVRLKYLDQSLKRRYENAMIYNRELGKLRGIEVPKVLEGNKHCYGQYTILLETKEKRDKLKAGLKELNIDTGLFYPVCLHTQKAFENLNYEDGSFKVGEDLCDRVLSLPVYPELTVNEIYTVCKCIIQLM